MEDDNEYVHGLKSFNTGEMDEMRVKAHKLCREFLNGAWRTVTVENFVIKKVGGGLSNLLYYCELPKGTLPKKDEPSRALLRIYGPTQDGANVLEAHFSECVVFTMLSEKQSGPRLYGIFPGGRLEQYIPARPLTTDELLDDELSALVAESFAQIHSMSVPLSKEPSYLWSTFDRWITEIEKYLQAGEVRVKNSEMARTLKEIDLRSELRWMKNFLIPLRSPVVFCHNDLQEGNILLKNSKSGEKSIILIDFEYCAYNYRAFDLANHLCETMYDYTNEEFPYFWAKPDNFPDRSKRERFVSIYLRKLLKTDFVSNVEVERVTDEIEAFLLSSHLFWAVWSVLMATTSTIEFDYWGYGHARLSAYFDQKKKLLQKTDVNTVSEELPSLRLEDSTPSLIETN